MAREAAEPVISEQLAGEILRKHKEGEPVSLVERNQLVLWVAHRKREMSLQQQGNRIPPDPIEALKQTLQADFAPELSQDQ